MKWLRVLVVVLAAAWIQAYYASAHLYPYALGILAFVLIVYLINPKSWIVWSAGDFLLAGSLVEMTGGVYSPFLIFLAFPVIAAVDRNLTYGIAGAESALLIAMAAVMRLSPSQWAQPILASLLLFLLAAISMKLAEGAASWRGFIGNNEFGLLEKTGKYLSAFKSIASIEELQNVLSPLLADIQQYVGSGVAVVALVDWEKDKASPLACSGSPDELESLKALLAGEWRATFSGYAILHQKNVLMKRPQDVPAPRKELGINSGVFVPLMEKENPFGILFAGDKSEHAFSRRHERLLVLAASLIGPFVKNALQSIEERKQRSLATGPVEVLQDLEVAKILQQKMLPPQLPELEGIEMAARLIPAKEVSGDFYDCFLLREKTLAINIGDVSGKSIPAALLVSMAKYIFRFPPSLYIRPSKLMELANKIVYMNGGGMFISDCFATLDLARNQFVYVSAGHPPLIHYRAKDNHVSFHAPTGPLLGISEDSRYREEAIALGIGDLLLFYSDGLTEIKMEERKVLGEEGLANLFQDFKHLPPSKLIQELLTVILRLYEDQNQKRDDISCLLLKIV